MFFRVGGTGNYERVYVSQTGDVLRTRVRIHIQQFKDPRYRFVLVRHHIMACAKDLDPLFKLMHIMKL